MLLKINQVFRNHPIKSGSDLVQIYAIFTLGVTACSSGSLFSWSSPTLPRITAENYECLSATFEEASYLIVIPPLACLLGSPFFAFLMNKIGRKPTLLIQAIPLTLSWIIILSSNNLYWWYFSRALYGFADGCLFTTLPTYLGEISTPKVRGSWGNIVVLAIYLGQFIINAVGGYVSIKLTAAILIILPLVYFVMMMFLPESPYYLLMNNDENGARDALKIFRCREDVDDELNQLLKDVSRQQSEKGSLLELFLNRTNRKALLAGAFIRGVQQFTGGPAYSTYTAFFFQEANFKLSVTISSMLYTIILGVTCTTFSFFLDKIGRKRSMIISSAGSAFFLILMAVYFYLRDYSSIDMIGLEILPVLLMFANLIVFSIGLGIVPTMIIGELFSTSIKAKGVCVLQIIFATYVGIVTKLFQILTENFGLFAPFTFFGIITVFGTFLCKYIVPETSGKTLEQIQQSLKK